MTQPEFNRAPWTCRWACIAGAVRSTRSVGSPDVIWTCGLRDRSTDTMLFPREECEHCRRWVASACLPSAGPPVRLTRLLPDYTRLSPVVAKTRLYERGERIFGEGATSEFFYTMASGSVKFVKTSLQGNDCIVGIASGICPLNPDGLDDERSFLATAVALADTTCIQVPKLEMVALFEDYPTVASRLYRELCGRLDASFTRMTELSRGTVENRLAQLFVRLARSAGRGQGSATFIPIRLSRQELADTVGTTVETCIRLMSRWGKRRFIYTSAGGFIVSDANGCNASLMPPRRPSAWPQGRNLEWRKSRSVHDDGHTHTTGDCATVNGGAR